MFRPSAIFVVAAILSIVAHVWLLDVVERMARRAEELSTADADSVQALIGVVGGTFRMQIQMWGAVALLVAAVVISAATFYFTLGRALGRLDPYEFVGDGMRLMPDFPMMFIPVFGLIRPLSNYRAIERWLLFDRRSAGRGIFGRALMPALVILFDLYVVLLFALAFMSGPEAGQPADEDALRRNAFLAAAVLAAICALLGAAYVIRVERNVGRLLREGRNRITDVFE